MSNHRQQFLVFLYTVCYVKPLFLIGLTALQPANNDEAAEPQNAAMTCDIRCKVCLSAESNTIFQPCHHITCCKACAQQLVNEFCPVCRAPINNVLPAYIS